MRWRRPAAGHDFKKWGFAGSRSRPFQALAFGDLSARTSRRRRKSLMAPFWGETLRLQDGSTNQAAKRCHKSDRPELPLGMDLGHENCMKLGWRGRVTIREFLNAMPHWNDAGGPPILPCLS